MKILVTGGSGYIGAHVCMELLEKGYKVIALDNLCNSKIDSLNRVAKLKQKKLRLNSTTEGDFFFEEIDIRSRKGLKEVFKNHKIEVVIHCAGLKSVEESIDEPLLYFDNNLNGSISLFKSMIEALA